MTLVEGAVARCGQRISPWHFWLPLLSTFIWLFDSQYCCFATNLGGKDGDGRNWIFCISSCSINQFHILQNIFSSKMMFFLQLCFLICFYHVVASHSTIWLGKTDRCWISEAVVGLSLNKMLSNCKRSRDMAMKSTWEGDAKPQQSSRVEHVEQTYKGEVWYVNNLLFRMFHLTGKRDQNNHQSLFS